MEDFWVMVHRWEPIGQGIFFLAIAGSLSYTFRAIFYYLAVLARGWPPYNEEDTEE